MRVQGDKRPACTCLHVYGGGALIFSDCSKTCFCSVLSHSQCMHMLNIYHGMSYMEKASGKNDLSSVALVSFLGPHLIVSIGRTTANAT